MDRERSALHRKGPIPVQISPMTSAALCLSLALQLPVASEPLAVDPDSLLALHQALQSFGEFQQPYSAPVDVTDPDAGVTDATVEISAGCVKDGPQVIILDADVDDSSERYLVLNEPWQSLPAGPLLLVSGSTATVISTQEANKETAQAEAMLNFLDYLPINLGSNSLAGPNPDVTAAEIDSDSFMQNFAMSSEGEPVSEAAFAAWEGKLPGLLLALWQRDGFARYRDDKLALVDPHLYAEVATAFLQGNPMEGADTFHVYAVTAFGQILLCGENTSTQISIDPHSGHVTTQSDVPDPADAAERNWKLAFLLEALDGPYLDVTDDDERPLHAHALDRLGPLAPNEIYSFSPAVSEGGWNAAHLVKTDRLAELKALAATVAKARPTKLDTRSK
ncbi:GAD-like domain-containing protein [Stenotrophomonas hibiscicola]|uniref:GAD-like domain-containing protein n=1 Tax=Stenotrophomonas hibiscicola TaxID=86189 RepID=UPI00320B53A4